MLLSATEELVGHIPTSSLAEQHPPVEHRIVSEQSWLTPGQVAERLHRTRQWVYKQSKRWTFVTRPSRKTLLISEQGLDRWLKRH